MEKQNKKQGRKKFVGSSETASQSPTRRRRAEGAPPTLLVPNFLQPATLSPSPLFTFPNSQIWNFFCSKLSVPHLSSFKNQDSRLWHTAARPSSRGMPSCQYPVICIFFPCPKVRLPPSSSIPFFPLFFFLYSLIN